MVTTLDRASVDESIARSFGADPVVMPVLDDLLQDIAVLGTPIEPLIGVLRPLRLRGVRRVLELGCGKGLAAVALARDLELEVTGVDAHAPFIDEARRRAGLMGLDMRCHFVHGDARQSNGEAAGYDAVMLLGWRTAFGSIHETVAALRGRVHPGGFMILDRDYALDPDAVNGEVLDHEGTAAALTAFGDRIVMEKHGRNQETIELAELTRRALERRAREMLRTYPGIAGTVWEWVERLRREVALHATGGPLMPAIWVVQKASR